MRKKRHFTIPVMESGNIEISGKKEILVCGCKCLDHYSESEIIVSVPEGKYHIVGEKMTMRWAGAGKLMICGKISEVKLC